MVDRQTGAGFDYPATVAVALRPIGTSAAPAAPATAAPAARTTASDTAPQAAVPGRTVAGAPF